VQDDPALTGLLQAILDDLAAVFQLGAEQVFVSASLGVARYPADGVQVEDLFKHADQALYVAKGAGRNQYSFFTPALQEVALARARLANDLRSGLTLQQFEVVYQPIVALATGQVHKAEALLRWHHPMLGSVSPAQFIGIAESTGLIIEIGEWVFHRAAAQVQAWRRRFDAGFQISVNKSPVQFHHDNRDQHSWATHLQTLGLPGDSIAVEITEGVLLHASESVTQQLRALRAGGTAVSLDDFGTGYSSMTYLQRFAIDFIKIDQSFVRNLQPGSTDLALCKAIIVMAHELGMRVVAEGVETQKQCDLLTAAGCDFGQGYLFARPMRVADFEVWMQTGQSG
jgi:EAL domain-containing protein (putative c-di-GMP-specific phosphodiesterase class I)